MKHMQVLGVELKDYSVREAMRKIDFFLREGRVATVAYITTRSLMEVEKSPELVRFLEGVDMTMAADADILKAAGITARTRAKEIENDEFLDEFLKKLARGKKKIYLLSGTKEELASLKECLTSYRENLRIVGSFSLDELTGDEDYLINDMNGLEPNVLISNIPSPLREQFFENHHMKMNVNIWLMLKEKVTHSSVKQSLFRKIPEGVFRFWFRRKVEKYQNKEEE